MSTEFDELQRLILEDARSIYSETVVDHAMTPRNLGILQDPDGFARVTGPCGDTMQMWLKVRDDVITDAAFMTDGCGPSIASGSMVTEMVKGKSISEARRTTQRDVLDALGDLPEESKHCALLAANTIRAAIKDYITMKREPWKRAYRKY